MLRLALLAGLALGACGGSETAALPAACDASPAAILTALRATPGEVRLDDRTLLSDCVSRAHDDGAIQRLGLTLTPAAQELAGRRTPEAAQQLGYLVGAAHRGGRSTNGVQAQLLRRLDRIAARADDVLRGAALQRGLAAGERRG